MSRWERWMQTLRRGVFSPPREQQTTDPQFVPRPHIEREIARSLARSESLVIYGPARQGKTTLLARLLQDSRAIYIECRPSFKRTHIYRVVLSSLGYSLLVEKKRRGKATTTLKWGISPAAVEAGVEGEIEQVMQSITVDLKNPSEVAHLLSRLTRVPTVVLNNFQLLDRGTRSNLLFDLVFFAERARVRFIIVGAWANEDYLEEIEPALASKLRYVYVPVWSDSELRSAFQQWAAHYPDLRRLEPRLKDFLTLAGGDISLFRSMLDVSAAQGTIDTMGRTDLDIGAAVQAVVNGRFRRGLAAKLKVLLAERDCYVTYLCIRQRPAYRLNPQFKPIAGAVNNADYRWTTSDPVTGREYAHNRRVRLDAAGNPEQLEYQMPIVATEQENVVPFLLEMFHQAVKEGRGEIELEQLVGEFVKARLQMPVAINEARLSAVFTRFGDTQRRALIVPPMLAATSDARSMAIVDRRLLLLLQAMSREDLADFLEDLAPMSAPKVRRRNHVSDPLNEAQKTALLRQYAPADHDVFAPPPDDDEEAWDDDDDEDN